MVERGELVERLTAATGPSRNLDVAIMDALCPLPHGDRWFDTGALENFLGERFFRAPSVTASVDEAIALVGRVLPGWHWYVDDRSAAVWPEGVYDESAVEASTPAIALLIALLKAGETQ